jgi:hypothetical protein
LKSCLITGLSCIHFNELRVMSFELASVCGLRLNFVRLMYLNIICPGSYCIACIVSSGNGFFNVMDPAFFPYPYF